MTVLEPRGTNVSRIVENPPTCPSCDDTFPYRYQLEFHFKWKHSNCGSLYICSDCNESCMDENKFKLHISTHGKRLRHTCEICGIQYKTELKLKMHQLMHRRVTGRQGTIDICSDFSTAKLDISTATDISIEETVAAPCRGCFSRKSFSFRHSRKNRFSECSYATCIKEKVCKHGNRWTHSL